MNMKKFMIAIAALALMVGGCSTSDDDETTTGITTGTDARPNWKAPNYNNYEQTMIIDVLLQDELVVHASSQDMMAAKVGDEVRGVADALQSDQQWIFPLVVAGNNNKEMIQLSYYCDKLHRIFTIEWTPFDAQVVPVGTDSIYKPVFIQ